MKRFLLCLIMILGLFNVVEAKHLKGGWIQYEYLGVGASPNTSKYKITVRQYLACNSVGPQIDGQIYLGVFDAGTNALYQTITVDSVPNGSVLLNKESYNVCINPKPSVCYLINKYVTVVDLPNNDAGYILAVQRCCRIDGIVNVLNSATVGITYTNKIPGTINGVSYRNNNSPSFVQKDTVLLCYNSPFTFDFSATDIDKDSLVYSFCDGLLGGDASGSSAPGAGTVPNPPANPPFISVPYNSPLYDGGYPLGSTVTIDPKTGIISGTAPGVTGDYVVAVCVQEFRHDTLIGTTKKEIHITVANCALKAAQLNPQYINCDNFTFHFFNESSNSNITKYAWSFSDSLSTADSNFSSLATPIHVYKDTGIYNLSLLVTASGGCQDSAKSSVRVFPGFKAKIAIKGSCIQTPYSFIDSSYSKYGTLTNWRWNFGETTVNSDTSTYQDPAYLYPTSGQKTVKFVVQNSNGCMDSTTQTLTVRDVPVLLLNPHNALICNTDTIQLSASEQGSTGREKYKWTSVDSIINSNTANPSVFPKDTATFYVTMTDSGCVAKDSVIVNTVPQITVHLGPDTTICKTDSIRLNAATQASQRISFSWLTNPMGDTLATVQQPWVKPLVNTFYYVQANLGNKCFARDTLLVNVSPYPIAIAGNNDSLCVKDSIIIHASVKADKFIWSPTVGFFDSTSLNTFVKPDTTTSYVLTAYYTKKNTCPKPARDTITITVIPTVTVNAGNDTSIVVNQPLTLMAKTNTDSSITNYLWTAIKSANTYLNNNTIYNPTAIYSTGTDSITYVVKATINIRQACSAQDTVKVLVFQMPPNVFVPDAFTPAGSSNNIFRPIPVGILNLDYFNVYNRLGQLLYTTNQIGQGWDGNYNGVEQPAGGYVYIVQGRDYKGKNPVFQKGTFVLIR